MSETKHFSYEANVELKTNSGEPVEIKEIVFMTPARVRFLENGVEHETVVSVDFVNRKIYFGDQCTTPALISEAFFQHLDTVNSLPEDFFEAPPGVVERANEMQEEQVRIKEQVGVTNG